MKSDRTKKYQRFMWIFKILSVFCFLVPFLTFAGVAFAEGVLVTEAFAIAATVLVTGFISVICILNKVVMKSKIWIVLLTLFFILENFLPVLLTIAICQIVDEIIFTPLYNYTKAVYITNKEIDRRP